METQETNQEAITEVGTDFSLELDYFDETLQADKLWQARTGLNEESLSGAIETIVFMSDKPVNINKIKKLIDQDMPLRVVHEAIVKLQEEYEQKHHGIRLIEVAEGYQFRTKATFSKYVQDLFKVNSLVLSPTALEVLAIIAYKQPISRTEIDKIRGVDSSHIVRNLMDKRLVSMQGRSNELGRPSVYGTTLEFLEVFNLANVEDLPSETELEELSQQGVGKISDISGLINSIEKQEFSFEEIKELDELSDSIKSIASSTDFTKSLNLETKRRKNGEGQESKSAFDILEDFVNSDIVKKENLLANDSELFTAVTSPGVVSNLTEGPFNIPEETDEDSFEMLDLDTGETISQGQEESDDLYAKKEGLEDDKKALAEALQEAHSSMLEKELFEENSDQDLSENIDLQENKLDSLQGEIAQKAKDLDIDLDFIKDS